jgi:hypothetical protein
MGAAERLTRRAQSGMIYAVQQAAQFVLRPLEIKHIYDFAIRLYRARFAPMFLSMALAQLPVSLMWISITLALVNFSQEMTAATGRGEVTSTDWMLGQADKGIWVAALLLFAMAYTLLVWPLGALTCSCLASRTLLGEEVTLAEAFSFAKTRYWPTQVALATFGLPIVVLALVMLVFFMALTAGAPGGAVGGAATAIILIIAGMIAMFIMWFRFFPALMGIVQCAEEPEGREMFAQGIWYLKRSYALTEGYFWRLFGLSLLLSFAIGLVQRGVSESVQLVYMIIHMLNAGGGTPEKLMEQMAVTQSDPVYFAIVIGAASIVSLLFPALTVCFETLLYYDLRCRKEGFDLLHVLSMK